MDSRGTQTYGYDPANQLNDAEIGGQTTSYIYNGDGVRTARETSSTYTEYVIDHNRSLPVLLYDETAYYVWGLDLIARISGSTQQYYNYDGLGSTRALTGNTGTTLATYSCDVFGTIRSQTGSQTNNFLFTGEWRDPETGFYFLRARYYDPVLGRFINRDPFGGYVRNPKTLNGYAYVTNNPANLVDPSGLYLAAPEFPVRKALFSYQDCYVGSEDECVSGGGNPSGAGPVGQGIRGPGTWMQVNEAMSARAAAYQTRITGRESGWAYRVNGVKFDGYNYGTLIETKGPGYAGFVKDGKFQDWYLHSKDGGQAMLQQAQRQIAAAQGKAIQWLVAEPEAAVAIRDLLQGPAFRAITVIPLP
ncbi:MAG TPA: RHS repeat-associated core domain-containing protein [Anaerolineales bacterium]|nr:RHS repeat-associated core domain-containing protein [Anaerolineales bacterium]